MKRSEAKEKIEDILLESGDAKISDVAEDILTMLEKELGMLPPLPRHYVENRSMWCYKWEGE